jgi:hypothetical protein
MVNFDAPNREQSCTRRERSNTPLQALQLLNDVQHVEAARALAERALEHNELDDAGRIRFLFRTVLSREPEKRETAVLQRQLELHLSNYAANQSEAIKLIQLGESKPRSSVKPEIVAAYTLIASTLLNMDETLTRN